MSNRPPVFFVPHAEPEKQEAVFADLAKYASRPVLALSQRVYSISFTHDGEHWKATVGEALSGKRPEGRDRKGNLKTREQSLSDPAVVLAIFPGVPYVVVTTQYLAGNIRSKWENPFFVGKPSSITYFSWDK
jgi:hypothetical protein